VKYLPGNLANGSVSYHAVFHDLPDGLQTHVYAPLGLDIRAKWSVGGSLPGEPKQPVELGLGIPREGLYLREDVKMKCNIMMLSFVKKTFKESHSKLVDRLVERAHIIESKIANERLQGLKTVAPNERMGHGDIFIAPPPGYQSQPGHQSQSGHLSMLSNGSSISPLNSPNFSQASTANSQGTLPSSPPYSAEDRRVSALSDVRPEQRASYASNSRPEQRASYTPDARPDQRTSYTPDARPDQRPSYVPLSSLDQRASHVPEYLTAQRYSPSQHRPQDDNRRSSYQAYAPAPVELPTDGPPVPPKDKQQFAAELPA
jgi:hypothetical protein